MIYVVTPNPSLDYYMYPGEIQIGKMNRAVSTNIMPGGKGINVATVLTHLGEPAICLGFAGGFTGKELQKRLQEQAIRSDFIWLDEGETRLNVKLSDTEINAPGPQVSEQAMEQLLRQMDVIKKQDFLVLSGSLPGNISDDLYIRIMKKMQEKQVPCIVDAAGDTLKNVLPLKPFLIKPNLTELEELLGLAISQISGQALEQMVIEGAQKLQQLGAMNVLVSLGEKGAILVDEKQTVLKIQAPEGKVINAIGAGDSMVAGFLYGYDKTKDMGEALKYGTAAGSASAFLEGLATGEEINAIFKTLCYTTL